MQGAIRKYRVTDPDELRDLVEDEFLPLVREVPGFVAYYVIDAGDGTAASITICEDSAGVEESTRRAQEWVARSASHLIEGAPEVMSGKIAAQATREGARA